MERWGGVLMDSVDETSRRISTGMTFLFAWWMGCITLSFFIAVMA